MLCSTGVGVLQQNLFRLPTNRIRIYNRIQKISFCAVNRDQTSISVMEKKKFFTPKRTQNAYIDRQMDRQIYYYRSRNIGAIGPRCRGGEGGTIGRGSGNRQYHIWRRRSLEGDQSDQYYITRRIEKKTRLNNCTHRRRNFVILYGQTASKYNNIII